MKNLLFSLCMVAAMCVVAQKPGIVISDKTGWHKIAETTVSFDKERDEISVIGADRFESIKFKVKDQAVNFQDIEIHIEDGETQQVQVRTPISAGGETREIKVKGGERDLTKVVFDYKTVDGKKDEKATVELWGYKSNVDRKDKDEKNMDGKSQKEMDK